MSIYTNKPHAHTHTHTHKPAWIDRYNIAMDIYTSSKLHALVESAVSAATDAKEAGKPYAPDMLQKEVKPGTSAQTHTRARAHTHTPPLSLVVWRKSTRIRPNA